MPSTNDVPDADFPGDDEPLPPGAIPHEPEVPAEEDEFDEEDFDDDFDDDFEDELDEDLKEFEEELEGGLGGDLDDKDGGDEEFTEDEDF